ncbi:MAG: phosphoribosylglycinamide formyltransferase [Sphingomicrobium sp.]
MADPRQVAVLISGRGSNMRALVEHATGFDVALVASNKPDAEGLDWARQRGLATWAEPSQGVERAEFDRHLGDAIEAAGAGTVALAGYMRILSPGFVQRFAGRIVNVHPSLLPKYKGLDTHARAIAAGETMSGCTVHLVTELLDDGEILGQADVPIVPGDTPKALAQRVLAAEHALYPQILGKFVSR